MHIEWKKIYEIGIEEIDRQHKKLFDIVYEIETTPIFERPKKIDAVIEQIEEYANHHFTTEEKLWKKYDLDEEYIKKHILEHNNILYDIKRMTNEHKVHGVFLTASIVDMLKTWLIDHVLGSDKEYARMIKEKES